MKELNAIEDDGFNEVATPAPASLEHIKDRLKVNALLAQLEGPLAVLVAKYGDPTWPRKA